MVDGINHILTSFWVNPVWVVGVVIHIPEEAMSPYPPALLLKPLEHGVDIVGVEVVIVILPRSPLHCILSNGKIEIVSGKRTVGIIIAIVPTAGNFVSHKSSTCKQTYFEKKYS